MAQNFRNTTLETEAKWIEAEWQTGPEYGDLATARRVHILTLALDVILTAEVGQIARDKGINRWPRVDKLIGRNPLIRWLPSFVEAKIALGSKVDRSIRSNRCVAFGQCGIDAQETVSHANPIGLRAFAVVAIGTVRVAVIALERDVTQFERHATRPDDGRHGNRRNAHCKNSLEPIHVTERARRFVEMQVGTSPRRSSGTLKRHRPVGTNHTAAKYGRDRPRCAFLLISAAGLVQNKEGDRASCHDARSNEGNDRSRLKVLVGTQ